MENMTKKFGEALREARILKNITQEELAAKLGTTKQTISHYENSDRSPKISVARKWAEALGMTIDDILGTDNYSEQDRMLLSLYHSLSDEGKAKLMERAQELTVLYGKKSKNVSHREAL